MSTVSVYLNKEQEAWFKERELAPSVWVKELILREIVEDGLEYKPQPDVRSVPERPHVAPLGPPRLKKRVRCPACGGWS